MSGRFYGGRSNSPPDRGSSLVIVADVAHQLARKIFYGGEDAALDESAIVNSTSLAKTVKIKTKLLLNPSLLRLTNGTALAAFASCLPPDGPGAERMAI